MKRIFSKLLGGALLFGLTMSLTSCEDVLGHWEKPTPNPITPGGGTPTVEDVIKYGFKVTDLNGDDKTTLVNSLKMSNSDGPVATAEVSGGKITIEAEKLSGITSAIDFWFEAEIGGKPYIAKVNIDPTTLSPESDKTLEMATLGDVILADGKFAVAGTEGQLAKIAYLGDGDNSDDTYNHGLALALKDVSETKAWDNRGVSLLNNCLGTQYSVEADAKGDMAGIVNTTTLVGHTHHPAAVAASEFKYKDDVAAGAHPTGTSAWFLPSAGQWDKMATAAGSYANLKTNVGLSGLYWSSTEDNSVNAWVYDFDSDYWLDGYKDGTYLRVRACLAF